MATSIEPTAQHMVLYDLSWDAYSKLLDALGDRRLRHTYQDGTLEMMSPSEKHDRIARFLGRIIQTASLEYGLKIRSVGSATRRSKQLARGVEPDESFFMEPASQSNGNRKRESNFPDLVVEVDLRPTELDRLDAYAKLGVRELWRYRKGSVEFFLLSDAGRYRKAKQSLFFPHVGSRDIDRFLARLEADDDENATILEFIAWLRKKLA